MPIPAIIAGLATAARVVGPTLARSAMAEGATARGVASSVSSSQWKQAASSGYNAYKGAKAEKQASQESSAPTSRERIPMSGNLPSGSY